MCDPIAHFELSCVREAALRMSHLQETVARDSNIYIIYHLSNIDSI